MATKEELLTGAGSLDEGTPAETYSTGEIDTTNLETYAGASETPTTPVNIPTTPTVPTGDTQNVANLYDLSRGDIIQKKSDIGQQYTSAVAGFDKGSIVDQMRLKTGGVADLDSAIENLKVDMNKSRPALMERYADVIDPRQREALISGEEANIAKQINDLSAVRTYRLGTIKDMTNAEIERGEQKLQGLEAQFNLYSSVLGDMDKADKIQSDMEKTALDIQKKQLDLKGLEDKYGYEFQQGKTTYGQTDLTNLVSQYPNNASFKNNNPGNIKYNEQWAQTLAQHGIEITKGTEALDGGNFAKYNSVEDALVGRNILLFNTSTYPNMTVDSAMKRYSNSGYGAEVAPEINGNKLMKDLTTAERSKLIVGQLKGEDQAMYQELLNQGIDVNKVVTEGGYVKTDKVEDTKGIGEMTPTELKKHLKNVTTVEDFNKTQDKTSTEIRGHMTRENIDNVLSDNIGKWELSESDVSTMLKQASDKVNNEYIQAEGVKFMKDLVDAENNQGVIDEVNALIDKDGLTKDQVKEILVEVGVLDEKGRGIAKGFKENSFLWFDDDSLDTLQGILDL